ARRRAATRSTYSWPPAPSLPAVFFRPPLETELARRRQVAEERGCGEAGWPGQVAFTAEPHPVLPVLVEGGDRAFSGVQRVRALTETRSAPRLADLSADRAEHVGNRLAVETRIRPLDLLRHAAGPREDDELLRRLRRALAPRGADHERCAQQIVVAAVGARSDQCLVERQTLASHLVRRKRIAQTEPL